MPNVGKSQSTADRRQHFVELAQGIFPSEHITVEHDELRVLGTDWTRNFEVSPLAAVFPTSIDQVAELVQMANVHHFPLVPSGGRTGLSGGCVATSDEIVVSFDRMNRILHFDPVDRLVHCQAGVVTAQLQQFAAEHGLTYPVDFSSSGSSQIGGNIATNAGGIRVIRHGMTRDWVAGMKVVTGKGDVLEFNRGLVKNATGYDLRHLFIGSEGTLGFIVEAEMQLGTAPSPQRVMVLGVGKLADLLSILQRFKQTVNLSAFEFFSDLAMSKVLQHSTLRRPLRETTEYYALIEYDEDQSELATQAFSDCLDQGWVVDGVLSQSNSQTDDLWRLRDGITESIAGYVPYKNDVSVRISQVPEFLDDIDGLVKEHYPDLEVCWFGHIGDGNLHLNILKPPELDINEFQERCRAINPLLFKQIQRRGGSISAEHGVGLLKRDYLEFSRETSEIDAMREIKHVFDPNGIMNPGKLLLPQ
ncbi:MAG: FAD-binding oxidoreductase [Gammaproteobacteria bacterium]|nr:FAD-binding oxidoreductase [Gammaproteobacteria bacterium]